MSGNSQQENTLRKRGRKRESGRKGGGEREREGAGFIKSLDNKLAPSDGRTDGGKIREGRQGGRGEGASDRERERARRERESIICSRLREMGRRRSECEWMMR